jgi:hypothetical protein
MVKKVQQPFGGPRKHHAAPDWPVATQMSEMLESAFSGYSFGAAKE